MSGRLVMLMAEDDEHDVIATRRAWKSGDLAGELHIVSDGEACLDYLWRRGEFASQEAPLPHLLLLDIHLPRLDGLQTLARIRAAEPFRLLPVVMLTTSEAEEDRDRSYALGANAYIVKPLGFDNLIAALQTIERFWTLAQHPGGWRERR